MQVYPGPYTAAPDAPLTLFLVGMRIHKPVRIRTWWPTFAAMSSMLRQLQSDPTLGLLAATLTYTPHPLLIQYWKSPDHLHRFARDPGLTHLPARRSFNRLLTDSADVGLWHESYVITPETTRTLYRNMPRMGLALATQHAPLPSHGIQPSRQPTPSSPGILPMAASNEAGGL